MCMCFCCTQKYNFWQNYCNFDFDISDISLQYWLNWMCWGSWVRMGQGVRTGLGHGGITCVLQTQFSSFLFFSEKIGLDVSSESSARQRIHMKNQALFSSKDKSKILKCRLLQFLFGTLRVKQDFNKKIYFCFTTQTAVLNNFMLPLNVWICEWILMKLYPVTSEATYYESAATWYYLIIW